ncbi:MAG TPA: T9SS type A sorting domain-containing protein [Bacteroidia bacterium]|nr:T9SS type A sorting domain-containing protein [Bacteroidia bacterium]
MKRIITFLAFIFTGIFANAQNGLESIIVENYYLSDDADSIASDDISASPGTLPVGSKTYRIYADMLPGYKFQAIYGINNPVHEFMISTTASSFYNNEDRGATTSNGVNNNYVDDNTVMLDSWLSVGAASSTMSGILKDHDDNVATVVNNDGALQNNSSWAGIPLTDEDGLIAVTPDPVTLVGITNEILVFDASNNAGDNLFSTINGSLACLTGSQGPDTVDNKVLIAQITTDGILCFKLNIQIGTPSGGVENYVAENPVGSEIQIPSLMYCSAVGVNETTANGSSFKILNNPSPDIIGMEINTPQPVNKSSYAIYDFTGRMLYTKQLGKISDTRTESIDISSLAKGPYLFELTLDGIASAKKIIKN